MYGILTGDSHSQLDRSEVTRFLLETDGPNLPSSLSLLFSEGDKVNFEQFSAWLEKHNEVRLSLFNSILPTVHGRMVRILN